MNLYEHDKVTEFKTELGGFYNGPSRLWFAYQDSLTEGCNRLAKIVSDLPVSEQTTKLLVTLLLRLDKKLSTGGVDDSDGTVGGFIEDVVDVLMEYVKLDPACVSAFQTLKNRQTCFGWEEPKKLPGNFLLPGKTNFILQSPDKPQQKLEVEKQGWEWFLE